MSIVAAMTELDPSIVERYADHLARKASARVTFYSIFFALIGSILGAVPLFPLKYGLIPHHLGFATLLIGAASGGYLGYTIGLRRAEGLRLQAQLTLHQLAVERSLVRPAMQVAPAPAPAAPAPVAPAAVVAAPVAPAPVAPVLPPLPVVAAPAPAPEAPAPVLPAAPPIVAPEPAVSAVPPLSPQAQPLPPVQSAPPAAVAESAPAPRLLESAPEPEPEPPLTPAVSTTAPAALPALPPLSSTGF
jgi:hypothetical protein